MKNNFAFFKKQDLILIGIIAIIAGILLFWNLSAARGGCTAVVEQDGQVLMQIDLSSVTEPETIELGGEYHVVLLAEPDAIQFASSDCPDQICVNTGVLTQAGQTAVCMPARISVRLEARQENQAEIDGYTG